MNKDIAIEVNHVSKSFRIYMDRGNTLKELSLFSSRRRFEERKVLDDISFNVKRGEAVGLIGHNGCGKSTTLKLLTKIMYPDSGSIKMKGRVSSLIELGAGFHPDMSGRENIYINASIFGLTKKEIDARLDDIISFSELEEYIDNPVRTYSSGMYMRLAFAVAINVDADILLIDEILAVGDASFQAKCFNKMKQIKAEGTTIVIVSHSMGQIEQFCDRSIWINDGKIVREGTPKEVDLEYLDHMNRDRISREQKELEQESQGTANNADGESAETNTEQTTEKSEPNVEGSDADNNIEKPVKRYGSQDATVTKIQLFNSDKKETSIFDTDDGMTIRVEYNVKKKITDAQLGIGIFRSDDVQCYGTNTRIDHLDNYDLDKDGYYEVTMPKLMLLPGVYWIDIAIETGAGMPVDYYKQAIQFEVISREGDVGVMRIPHTWHIEK